MTGRISLTRHNPTVFRRNSSLISDAAGIDALVVQCPPCFNAHFVLPAITEVVVVAETFVATKFEIVQLDLIGIGRKARASVMVNAIVLAMDVEQIQMLVAPAEGNLQRVMQIGDRTVAAYQKPPDRKSVV